VIFFTSICANYLPKAMALAESVKQHCKGAYFVLCLVEREVPQVAAEYPHFDEIVLAKDAGWDHFDRFMFRHAIVEASTAVKAQFMLNLVTRHPEQEKFVYLDPDVLVYGEFVELDHALDTDTIVLCPHLLRPGNIDMEISSLAHGCYNLGFLAVRRSQNALDFLRWWAERLFQFCYDDIPRGIFTDQRWIDLAPCFFDVRVLKHHGYDFATWSLLNSDLREVDGHYVINGDPLRFIHFSGLDSGTIDKAIGWWLTGKNRATFVKLYGQYKALLQAHGQAKLGKLPWSYATYTDGRKISNAARVAYRNRELWEKIPEPFSASDDAIEPPERAPQPPAESVKVAAKPVAMIPPPPPSVLDQVVYSVRTFGIGTTVRKAARRVVRVRASGKR
jgi:hypothetical protein